VETMESLLARQLEHAVGQLDLVAGAAFLVLEDVEDLGLQDISAVDEQVRRGGALLRLLHHAGDLEAGVDVRTLADDAVFVRLGGIALLDGNDVGTRPLVELDHTLHAATVGERDHVRQEQRERLVADDITRAPHRMAESERLLLAGEAGLSRKRLQALQPGELVVLATLRQRVVQLELDVEVVFDDGLVAAGDEDEVLDTRLARLVDHVLDHRAVDHGQHLLGYRLGGRQEAGSEAGDGKDCLADFLHVRRSGCDFVGNGATRHFHAEIEEYSTSTPWARKYRSLFATARVNHMVN